MKTLTGSCIIINEEFMVGWFANAMVASTYHPPIQRTIVTDKVMPGLYKHYKGNLYRVDRLVRHHETQELWAVYLPGPGHPDFNTVSLKYIRPVAEWFDEIYLEDGKRVTRFITFPSYE